MLSHKNAIAKLCLFEYVEQLALESFYCSSLHSILPKLLTGGRKQPKFQTFLFDFAEVSKNHRDTQFQM